MNDFKRLLDDEGTDAAPAELLRFARSERPPPESRARILEALAARAGVAAIDPSSQAPAAPASSLSSVAPPAAAALPLKWAILGLAAVALPVAAWLAFRATEAPSAPQLHQAAPAVARSVAPEAKLERAAEKSAPSATVRIEDLPVLPSATAAKAASSGSSATARDEAAPSLADEVKAIGRAKSALSAGNPSRALQELDAYAREFPAGKLRQEATVTRIEALVASGDRASAKRLGQRFLSHGEKSPYAARVRSLIGE